MHIPVRVGLVGQNGMALPLTLDGENETGPENRVLELRDARQSFVFVDVADEPLSVARPRIFPRPRSSSWPTAAKDRAVLMGM